MFLRAYDESVFQPLQDTPLHSVTKCNVDNRKDLRATVVLTGGTEFSVDTCDKSSFVIPAHERIDVITWFRLISILTKFVEKETIR